MSVAFRMSPRARQSGEPEWQSSLRNRGDGLARYTRRLLQQNLQVADPVGGGFVESLARPGGNMTGFTDAEYAMSGKWLEILKEIAPSIRRVLVLLSPGNTARWTGYFQVL
ncbi:MAG TPA: ABC transporter substrate binding protein, partial [Xanthobacteraceae bacterium]|nr:ABC transporter substrate binding protein [Xanthobacteraceae bacterium]